MSVAGCQSDVALVRALAPVRADVEISLACNARDGRTGIKALAERGGYRAKFPRSLGRGLETVIVNSGGGVAGGDCIKFDIAAGENAHLTISTATAERIYRSIGPLTTIDVRLRAGAGSTLCWLPQPTILFSGARLDRRFEVDLAADARLAIAETIVYGRIASGEVMGSAVVSDRWRIRRNGRLAFAETTRLDGDVGALLDRAAVASGARATALMVVVAPDAEELRDRVRNAVADCSAEHGVSAWNGLLVVRALASGLESVHDVMRRAVEASLGGSAPRAWAV